MDAAQADQTDIMERLATHKVCLVGEVPQGV